MNEILKRHIKKLCQAVRNYEACYPRDGRLRRWAIRGIRTLKDPTSLNRALIDRALELIEKMNSKIDTRSSCPIEDGYCNTVGDFLKEVSQS